MNSSFSSLELFLFKHCQILFFLVMKSVLKTDDHSFISHESHSFCSFLLMSSLIFLSIWKDFHVGDRISCSLEGTDFLSWLQFDEDCLTTTVNIIKGGDGD